MDRSIVILVNPDSLDLIKKDPNFGKSISEAIDRKRSCDEDTVPVYTRNGNTSATGAYVVSDCFSAGSIQIIVIEDGRGWQVKYGREKPTWSSLTWKMVRDIFSGMIPKRKKKIG